MFPITGLGHSRFRPLPCLMAPCSINSSATLISCCCPGVSKKVMICPFRFTLRWILVLNPPRLRPRAFFCPCCMLMRSDHRTIYQVDFPVYSLISTFHRLQFSQDPIPHPRISPTATVHCGPFPLPFRQVPPGRSSSQYPQDPIHHLPVIHCWSACVWLLWGKYLFQLFPLFVC